MVSQAETPIIEIVDFEASYAEAFKALNVEWMAPLWDLHQEHDKVLEDPQKYVLDSGGVLLIALLDGEPVGSCALLRSADCDDQSVEVELAKMCVTPAAQGHGIGRLLAQHIIQRAKDMPAHRIYLKTATALQAAIALYEKLGFERLDCYSSTDTRCDIEMQMLL